MWLRSLSKHKIGILDINHYSHTLPFVQLFTNGFFNVLAQGSWSKLRLKSKIVNCPYVSWLKTQTKLKCYLKCLNIMLSITDFHRHFMMNHYLMTGWNVDLILKLLHDPEAWTLNGEMRVVDIDCGVPFFHQPTVLRKMRKTDCCFVRLSNLELYKEKKSNLRSSRFEATICIGQ